MIRFNQTIAFLLACFLIFMGGCSSTPSTYVTNSTDEFGNTVIEYTGHRTVMLDSLPYELIYNNKSITLVDVCFYENVVDYSHNLFIISTLDVSNLDDAELHWLTESDLDVSAYLTCEKNNYDFSSLATLGSLLLTDEKQLIFVHTSSFFKENRYSFSGAEISLTVTATQEETYEYITDNGDTCDLHVAEKLHYNSTIEEKLPNPDEINYPLNEYISKWLYEKASS